MDEAWPSRSALERVNVCIDDSFRFKNRAIRGKDETMAGGGLAMGVMMAIAPGV